MPILTLPASKGGDLVTSLPPDQVGLANWVQKTNWRSEDGQEITREGDVLFHRNDPLDVGEPITGIFHARHPNGTPVTFFCTPSSIYRFLGSLELGYASPVEDFGIYGRAKFGYQSEYYPVFGSWAGAYLTENNSVDDYVYLLDGGDQQDVYKLGNVNNDRAPRYRIGLTVHGYDPGVGRSVDILSVGHAAPKDTLTGAGDMQLLLTYTGRTDADIYADPGFKDWSVTTMATSTNTELRLPGDWSEFTGRRLDVRVGNDDLANAVVGAFDPVNGFTPVAGGTWSPSTPSDATVQSAQVHHIYFHTTATPLQTEPADQAAVMLLFPDAVDLGGGWYRDPDYGVFFPSGQYIYSGGAWLKVYGASPDLLGFYEATRGVWFISFREDVATDEAGSAIFKGHLAYTGSSDEDWNWFTGTSAQVAAGTETRLDSGHLLGVSSVYSAERMVHSLTDDAQPTPTYTLKLWGDWLPKVGSGQVEVGLLTSSQTVVTLTATVGTSTHEEPSQNFGYATSFTFQEADIISGLGDFGDVGADSVVTYVKVGDVFVPDTGLPVYETRSNFTWARINPSEDPSNPSGAQYLFGTGRDPKETSRWQMVDVDGYAVFNNGYDLPFVYDLSDTSTYRGHLLYELRENGYAFCDTMSTLGGVVTFQDVAELKDTQAQLLKGNSVFHRASPLGYNLTAGHGAYGPVRNDPSLYARIRFQIIGSPFNNPERWGAGVEATTTGPTAQIDVITLTGGGAADTFTITIDGNAVGPVTFNTDLSTTAEDLAAAIRADPSASLIVAAVATGADITLTAYNAGTVFTASSSGTGTATTSDATTTSNAPGDSVVTTPYRMLSWEVNTSKNLKVLAAGDPVADTPAYANGTVYAAGDLVHYLNDLYQALEDGTADNADPNAGSLLFKNLGALPAYDLQTTIISGPTWDNSNSVWQWTMADTAGATATDRFAYNPDIDSLAPQPFAYKLQGDSSPIINAAELQDRLVIFKANSIYAARLTNDPLDPLAFERLYYGNESLFWKWTLVAVEGDFLFYAGRTKFYKVDLVRGTPEELPKLMLCDNLFFDHVSAEDAGSIHTSVNSPTSEVWVSVPGKNQTLCWSWLWDHCSLVDFAPIAAQTIEADYSEATPTYLFVYSRILPESYPAGLDHDGVFIYGLSSHPLQVFGGGTRVMTRGGAYAPDPDNPGSLIPTGVSPIPTLELVSGVGLGGQRGTLVTPSDPYKDYDEGRLLAYQVVLSPSTDKSDGAEVRVRLNGYDTPSEDGVELLDIALPSAEKDNNIPVHYVGHGFQDVITVDSGKFVGISKRIFDIQPTKSRSAARTEEG